MKRAKIHQIIPSWLLVTAAVFVSLVMIIFVVALSLSELYRERIMPGVKVAGISLSGKTPSEARLIINGLVEEMEKGVKISYEDKNITIPSPKDSLNPDLAISPVVFDPDETLRQAWAFGHNENSIKAIVSQFKFLWGAYNIDLQFALDKDMVMAYLEKEFASYNIPARNASIDFSKAQPEISVEKVGKTLQYNNAILELETKLKQASRQEIVLSAKEIVPEVSAQEALPFINNIEDFLNFPNTVLQYEKDSWKLDQTLAKQWLGFSKQNGQIKVSLDKEKIKEYLVKEIAIKVDREPIEAKLNLNNGRVSVWQSGADGIKVDLDKTAEKVYSWPQDKPEKIEVAVNITPSSANDATAEQLGIKEIIGTGISQFAGSPVNRRHNIKTGATALHGLLIKPGEEFSLLKALGEIDGQHGYLPELVIKENKTIPEYGGGLCQIGTTMFRATFNSGLPVTQRRNHSYRVTYYEPAGTDATIYDPAPDYRFVNDTGHYILIQARLEGNQLAFDFWGTKDDRKVEFTKPVIYNIVAPGPTKIIETTDLKEGEKKCTEKAHNGADAYFDYKVTYSSGEIKEKRFSSHYVPWQAVCLVGVKTLSTEQPSGPPTSTITPTVEPSTQP